MQVSSVRATQPAKPVRFGCHVFAYMAPNQYPGQDEFIRSCLSTGGNSVKRQRELPFGTIGDETVAANSDFEGRESITLGRPCHIGWGMAYQDAKAKKAGMQCVKWPEPAPLDIQFDKAVEEVVGAKPLTLMAHLRQTLTFDSHPDHLHPFKINNWTFMHRGALPAHAVRELKVLLKTAHEADDRVPLPKGKTDSELMACYVAYKLLQKTGKLNSAEVDTPTLQLVFKEAVSDIILWPGKLSSQDLRQSVYNMGQGALRHSGNIFVFSDGDRLLTSCATDKPNTMHLGIHQSASGEQEYLIANQKLQPLPDSGLAPIQWEELPDHQVTVLTREKSQDGTSKIKKTEENLPIRSHKKRENFIDSLRFLRYAFFRC